MRRFSIFTALISSIICLSGCASILVSWGLESKQKVYEKEYDDSFRDTTIVVDGVKLFAYWSPASAGLYRDSDGKAVESQKTAIVIHGYLSRPYKMEGIAKMYRDSLGYNILLPTLRHHDHSEGDFIQMGWLDRLDILEWSKVAHKMFSDTLQVIHGVSMGGATTMMVSGEDTPDYMKAFVDDCGYTDVWAEASHVIRSTLNVNEYPTMANIEKTCVKRYGWSTHEASCLKQVAKCTKPMLFIHGEKDDFVPTWMAVENYNAKTQGYRELWIAPGSIHARSFKDHPAEYTARVRAFLAGHVE